MKKFGCYRLRVGGRRASVIHDRSRATIEIFFFINSFANLFVFPSFRSRLKLECEKLASEKTEMQRHYVMVSERVPMNSFHHPIRPLQWQTAESLMCLISKSNPATTMPELSSLPFCTREMPNEIKKAALGMFQRFMEMSKYFHRNSPIPAKGATCLYHGNFSPCRFFCATSYHRVDCTWTHDGYLIIIFFHRAPCLNFFCADPRIASCMRRLNVNFQRLMCSLFQPAVIAVS